MPPVRLDALSSCQCCTLWGGGTRHYWFRHSPGHTALPAAVEGFDRFKETLVSADGSSRVDLVLSCVDNYEARITINQVRPGLGAAAAVQLGSCQLDGAVRACVVSLVQCVRVWSALCSACVCGSTSRLYYLCEPTPSAQAVLAYK